MGKVERIAWWLIYATVLLGGILIGHYIVPYNHERPIIVEEERP